MNRQKESPKRKRGDKTRSRPKPAAPDSSEHSSLPRPSKSLGQNFLIDKRAIERIVNALDPGVNETIIEIGPGQGALTASLVERAGRLIAIEFDRNLVPFLEDRFGSRENFRLVQSDALVTDFCKVIRPATHARVVANLPYNIATAILQRLIEQRHCLTEMVLMLQKEVVDRMIAVPGSKDRGFLSVLVEAFCVTEKLFDVGPGSFRPAPKIWSTVVRVIPRPAVAAGVRNEKLLLQVVSAGFLQRRKTILNNLRSAPSPLQEIIKSHGGASIVLCEAEVPLERRAETLTLDEWARIVKVIE